MKKHSSKQLYFRMFWGYTTIVFLVVSALVIYFLSVAGGKALKANTDARDQVCRDARDYLEETGQQADYVYKALYGSKRELDDLIAYFQLDKEEYQKYCLDKYMSTDELEYQNIYDFVNEVFSASSELKKIELISYATMEMTQCYPQKVFYPGKDGKKRIEELEQEQSRKKGELVYLKEIRNPDTLQQEGCMILTFDAKETLEKIQDSNPYVMLAVASQNDQEIYVGKKAGNWKENIRQRGYDVIQDSVDEYVVYSYVNKKEAADLSGTTFLAIMGMGFLAIAVGVVSISCYVRKFTARVETILDAMNRVKTGNLKDRIQVDRVRDELDMIAGNFNEMCGRLELYIQKSYLAEIETKNAQMQALQSQINPHFLYNTLEAIRMKAICNGDREVGKCCTAWWFCFEAS